MYKIITQIETGFLTGITKENSVIPINPANSDYQKFIQDVAEQGIEIVEGPDIIEPSYIELRQQEYPSLQEQQDMQYWDQINGTTIWQDLITSIKEQYPKTITGGTTIGPMPDWIQEAADNWMFNKQLREYIAAMERLSHYALAEGQPEIREEIIISTEEVFNEETGEMETIETTQEVITQTAIEPLKEFIEVTTTNPETMESVTETIRNPLIVQDETERAEAQAVVDSTPQEVVDAYASVADIAPLEQAPQEQV
jgi:hypothetical protein